MEYIDKCWRSKKIHSYKYMEHSIYMRMKKKQPQQQHHTNNNNNSMAIINTIQQQHNSGNFIQMTFFSFVYYLSDICLCVEWSLRNAHGGPHITRAEQKTTKLLFFINYSNNYTMRWKWKRPATTKFRHTHNEASNNRQLSVLRSSCRNSDSCLFLLLFLCFSASP